MLVQCSTAHSCHRPSEESPHLRFCVRRSGGRELACLLAPAKLPVHEERIIHVYNIRARKFDRLLVPGTVKKTWKVLKRERGTRKPEYGNQKPGETPNQGLPAFSKLEILLLVVMASSEGCFPAVDVGCDDLLIDTPVGQDGVVLVGNDGDVFIPQHQVHFLEFVTNAMELGLTSRFYVPFDCGTLRKLSSLLDPGYSACKRRFRMARRPHASLLRMDTEPLVSLLHCCRFLIVLHVEPLVEAALVQSLQQLWPALEYAQSLVSLLGDTSPAIRDATVMALRTLPPAELSELCDSTVDMVRQRGVDEGVVVAALDVLRRVPPAALSDEHGACIDALLADEDGEGLLGPAVFAATELCERRRALCLCLALAFTGVHCDVLVCCPCAHRLARLAAPAAATPDACAPDACAVPLGLRDGCARAEPYGGRHPG